jgi:hypothetical protein
MLCVYGIVKASHPGVVTTGVHGATTTTVRTEEFAAVVSEVGEELLARRRDVEAHPSVLEAALREGDVLPFRFGTVVEDDEGMRSVLDHSAPRFRELFTRLGGRVQMTVKAVRDDDAAVRAVVGSDDRLRRVVTRSRGSAEWSDRIALGERVASAVDELTRRDAEVIVDRLAPLAQAVSAESVAPPGVASVALLMDPGRLAALDAAVAALHDDFGHRLRFDYAGPMPAYSFVT